MSTHLSISEVGRAVLSAISLLRSSAYGVTIHEKLQELVQPGKVSLGALYFTLDWLEEKGYVSSWLGDPTVERGARAKRFYRLEALGERALQESPATAQRVWRSIAEVWGQKWANEWRRRWRKEAS